MQRDSDDYFKDSKADPCYIFFEDKLSLSGESETCHKSKKNESQVLQIRLLKNKSTSEGYSESAEERTCFFMGLLKYVLTTISESPIFQLSIIRFLRIRIVNELDI